MLKRKWEEHKLQQLVRHLVNSIRVPVMEQWVDKVRSFSSQYNTGTWAADQVIGAPKVYPRYGDHHGAWAQSNPDANEFIELEFAEPVYVSGLDIYETLNAGAIHRISALNRHGTWMVLWTGQITRIESSRIFKPTLKECPFATNVIKLELNCTTAGTWCEIDAVKLTGIKTHKATEDPPERTKVADDLSILLENTDKSDNFADVLFIVSGQEVAAHRCILSARSDYFRAMFNNNMRESHTSEPIHINSVECGVFKAVMQYIYCGKFLKEEEFDAVMLVAVIRAADMFMLDGLKTLCRYLLNKSLLITTENVCELYSQVSGDGTISCLEDIKKDCLEFMATHMKKISRGKAFSSLPKDVMLEIVQQVSDISLQ